MKTKYALTVILISYFLLAQKSFAQAGQWTWLSGDSGIVVQGNYVTPGLYDPLNYPPSFYEAPYWLDSNKCLFIFVHSNVLLNNGFMELWKYNPYINQWMYIKSFSDTINFGIKGIADSINSPGNREFCAVSWVDNYGTFWMFGGGFDSRNDLWKLDVNTLLWTWVSGSQVTYLPPAFGIKGIPSINNTPGNLRETNASWVDSLNNLWLFGGQVDGGFSAVNHLWKYNIVTDEWAWMQGDTAFLNQGDYGVIGIPAYTNLPPTRYPYAKMKDSADNAYIFGGWNLSNNKAFNDVWKYEPAINAWTWVAGSSNSGSWGSYPAECNSNNTAAPVSRCENKACATDQCGNMWLFGGATLPLSNTVNDVWVFHPDSNRFRLVYNKTYNSDGIFGTKGIASSLTKPPGGFGGLAFIDSIGKFYIVGGAATNWLSNAIFKYELNQCCVACGFSPPGASFNVSQNLLCEKGCVDFYDNSGCHPTQWQWTFTDAVPDTSTDQNPVNICYNNYGTFPVTLIASNSAGTDSITYTSYITVVPNPVNPNIIQNTDTLFCTTSAAGYQWYMNGVIIPGATQSTYIITQQGLYYVIITDSNQCNAASNSIVITGLDLSEIEGLQTVILPNPNDGSFAIEINSTTLIINLKLQIINVLGETIFEKEFQNVNGEFTSRMNLTEQPKGIYFLKFIIDGATTPTKIIIK